MIWPIHFIFSLIQNILLYQLLLPSAPSACISKMSDFYWPRLPPFSKCQNLVDRYITSKKHHGKLTIPQSLRVAMFWFRLLEIQNGNLIWGFWSVHTPTFRGLCKLYGLEELLAFPQLYSRTANNLETILKCIKTYLSRGNFEDNLNNNWLRSPVAREPSSTARCLDG